MNTVEFKSDLIGLLCHFGDDPNSALFLIPALRLAATYYTLTTKTPRWRELDNRVTKLKNQFKMAAAEKRRILFLTHAECCSRCRSLQNTEFADFTFGRFLTAEHHEIYKTAVTTYVMEAKLTSSLPLMGLSPSIRQWVLIFLWRVLYRRQQPEYIQEIAASKV